MRANLINFILTNKGERPLNTTYGSDIRKYLFSEITDSSYAFGITGYNNTNSNPSTTAISGVQPYTNLGVKDLEAQLKSEISTNFPQLIIKQISITPSQDDNTVEIKVIYSFMTDENNQIILNI